MSYEPAEPKKKSLDWNDFLAWRHSFGETMGHGWTNPSNPAENKDRPAPDKPHGGGIAESEGSVGGLHGTQAADKGPEAPAAVDKAGHSDPRDTSRPVLGVVSKRTKNGRAKSKRSGNSNRKPSSR